MFGKEISGTIESFRYISPRTVVATRGDAPGQFNLFDEEVPCQDLPEIRENVQKVRNIGNEEDENGRSGEAYREIIYNYDPTTKELREHQLKLINQQKWERIKSIREQMGKDDDNRNLFLIKAGTYIENSKSKKIKSKFFKGYLSDDILAVINRDNKKLELIRFFSKPIAIAYIPASGQREFNCIDLIDKYDRDKMYEPTNRKDIFLSQKTPHISLKKVRDINDFLSLLEKR